MATSLLSRAALLAALLLAACVVVTAHSWLDCADWRFNDPAAATTPALRRWGDSDGKCFAHARRYEVGIKPFGKMDEVQFYRHYVQKFGSSDLACRRNNGGFNGQGSNEGIATPRSLAYSPNKNVYNQAYGIMAQVYAGQQLCWRWPAKNHFAHVNVATNPLFVNWDDVANRAAPDLTQNVMDTKRLSDQTMLWATCPVPGPASNGDSTGTGSELRPCGGCFTVPQRAAGIYTVQWEWPFKNANSETYTSCADIEVLASTGTAATTVNCAVSAWGAWGTCSSNCGSGTQIRTRTITTEPTVTGTACPTLTDAQACNTQSCSSSTLGTYVSEHVVYQNSLVDFTSWSWARSYNLRSTAVVRGGTGNSIQWTPRNWDAIYLHYDIGASSLEEYQSISFWIHGGSTGGQSITFSLVTTGRRSSALFTYPVPRRSIVANQWTKVDIKFSDLGFTKGYFDGIWWQANSWRTQSTVYIDDIYFMHVHEGGAQGLVSTAADACEGVACPANSACLGGECYCTDGYWGTECTTAPIITDVSVRTLNELPISSLSGGETLTVTWTANGTLPVLSVLLYQDGIAVPTYLANQVANQGYYTWFVPTTLEPGTYTVRVAYSKTVYGSSGALTKASEAVADGCITTTDCSGHGVCDEDTAPLCVCRFGYTGLDCAAPPAGVTKLRSTIIVNEAIAVHDAAPDAFRAVLQQDLAAGLQVQTDQIELVSVEKQSAATSLVTFDLLTGGEFAASAHAITDSATYSSTVEEELARDSSSFNHGTYTYAAASTSASGAHARARASASSLMAVGALVLAAAAAVAF